MWWDSHGRHSILALLMHSGRVLGVVIKCSAPPLCPSPTNRGTEYNMDGQILWEWRVRLLFQWESLQGQRIPGICVCFRGTRESPDGWAVLNGCGGGCSTVQFPKDCLCEGVCANSVNQNVWPSGTPCSPSCPDTRVGYAVKVTGPFVASPQQ